MGDDLGRVLTRAPQLDLRVVLNNGQLSVLSVLLQVNVLSVFYNGPLRDLQKLEFCIPDDGKQ